jgi:hypothetical protein
MAQQLGEAKGKITLDASSVENVAGKVKGVGRDVENSLGRVDAAAKKTSVSLGGLGKVVGAVGGIFGVQMGLGMVKQIGDAVIASAELATQYRRQMVAAESLAGSQAKLNSLLSTYHKVTKDSVDNAQALADVTKLQATGFADTAMELETFMTAVRGISVAMGANQDYVVSQLQLTIANQSEMRLDQLGLGVAEVKQRMKELRVENKGLTKEMAWQQAVLETATKKFGALADSTEAQATGLEKLRKAWKDLRLEQGQDAESPVNQVAGGIAGFLNTQRMNAKVIEQEDPLVKLGEWFSKIAANMPKSAKGAEFDEANEIAADAVAPFFQRISDWIEARQSPKTEEEFNKRYGLGRFSPTGSFDQAMLGSARASGITSVADPLVNNQEQKDIISNHYRAIQDIERSASSARIAATRDFENQRTQIIKRFGLTLVREAEDFALASSRASTDFNRSVSDMRRDAARRESDAREELERGLGEMRANHDERVAEITSRHHKDMEDAEADHKERLLGAAARLDAAGVVQEQRRFAREKKKREDNHKDQIKKAKDSLDKQEKQRREALERQLEIARRSDERRLEDMQRDFEYRRQIEQEDREIRLNRMKEDHQLQLDELAKNHEAKQEQINQQEADEKIAREEKFKQELIQAGVAHEKWLNEQDEWERKSLNSFTDWWDDINDVMNEREENRGSGSPDGGVRDTPSPVMQAFGDGGPVNRTGPAIVHAGEYVLTGQTTGALRGMLGNFNQGSLIEAAGGKSITVAEGAIQIQTHPGMDVDNIGQIVRSEMLAALQIAS